MNIEDMETRDFEYLLETLKPVIAFEVCDLARYHTKHDPQRVEEYIYTEWGRQFTAYMVELAKNMYEFLRIEEIEYLCNKYGLLAYPPPHKAEKESQMLMGGVLEHNLKESSMEKKKQLLTDLAKYGAKHYISCPATPEWDRKLQKFTSGECTCGFSALMAELEEILDKLTR